MNGMIHSVGMSFIQLVSIVYNNTRINVYCCVDYGYVSP